jgi:hypothetical protein
MAIPSWCPREHALTMSPLYTATQYAHVAGQELPFKGFKDGVGLLRTHRFVASSGRRFWGCGFSILRRQLQQPFVAARS